MGRLPIGTKGQWGFVGVNASSSSACMRFLREPSLPCTARSVILVHDTLNGEDRARVESVALDLHPRVVYYELDFVPGYIYRTGAPRNSAGGGLGLILTDHTRDGESGQSPRELLYYEPVATLQRVRAELAAQESGAGAPVSR